MPDERKASTTSSTPSGPPGAGPSRTSSAQTVTSTRPGSIVGAIGAPHDVVVPIETVIFRNVGLRGGVAPVRRYLPELLEAVLDGAINPGRIFDFETDLEHVVDGYRAMDERRAVKAMVRVGAVH